VARVVRFVPAIRNPLLYMTLARVSLIDFFTRRFARALSPRGHSVEQELVGEPVQRAEVPRRDERRRERRRWHRREEVDRQDGNPARSAYRGRGFLHERVRDDRVAASFATSCGSSGSATNGTPVRIFLLEGNEPLGESPRQAPAATIGSVAMRTNRIGSSTRRDRTNVNCSCAAARASTG
jgi:hypothetical protein